MGQSVRFKNPYSIKLNGDDFEKFLVSLQIASNRDTLSFFDNDMYFIYKIPKDYFDDWKNYVGIKSYYKDNMDLEDWEFLKGVYKEKKLNAKMFVLKAWELTQGV